MRSPLNTYSIGVFGQLFQARVLGRNILLEKRACDMENGVSYEEGGENIYGIVQMSH